MSQLPPEIRSALDTAAALDPAGSQRLEQGFVRLLQVAEALTWARQRVPRLVAARSRQEVLEVLVDEAVQLTDAPEVWAVAWSGRRRDSFAAMAGRSQDGTLPRTEDGTLLTPMGLSRSIIGRSVEEGRPAWSDDALQDARFVGADSIQAMSLRSVGSIPIAEFGVLYLFDPTTPGRFGAGTRAKLPALCSLAAEFLSDEPTVDTRVPTPSIPGLVGSSAPMATLFRTIRAFAPMPWPTLILGETGTGKEAVARALHQLSERDGRPFVAVNCGAIPDELAESQLFGHERGAFTGADRRTTGLIEEVRDGTLFLDEVGELSARAQVKLLRLLQEGTYTRVGDTRERPFRGRIVAATHRAVGQGEGQEGFRQDLFHRLSACVIKVPRLDERRTDVPELASFLLRKNLKQLPGADSLRLTASASTALQQRAWPGNVRELENSLRTAIARALAEGTTRIEAHHLAVSHTPAVTVAAPAAATTPADATSFTGDLVTATTRFQQARVREALEHCGDNRTQAAKQLGVSRQWLHRLITRWDQEGPW